MQGTDSDIAKGLGPMGCGQKSTRKVLVEPQSLRERRVCNSRRFGTSYYNYVWSSKLKLPPLNPINISPISTLLVNGLRVDPLVCKARPTSWRLPQCNIRAPATRTGCRRGLSECSPATTSAENVYSTMIYGEYDGILFLIIPGLSL